MSQVGIELKMYMKIPAQLSAGIDFLVLCTTLTNLVFAEELFKEVDELEEKGLYSTCMAVAVAGFNWCFS